MTKNERNLFSFAFGETPDDATRNAVIKFLVSKFKRTGDMATLAELAQLDPPGRDASIGKAISEVLINKRPDKKAYRDALWSELDRVFNYLREQGRTSKESYDIVTEIYFPDQQRSETKDPNNVARQHRDWLKEMG